MTFPIHRMHVNHGTGVTSGQWLFEEFMFCESVWGRATVRYDPVWNKLDDEFVCLGAHVAELLVFDDDSSEVNIYHGDRPELDAMVLEAFDNDMERVEEFEMGEL